jgi:hypothetical protein
MHRFAPPLGLANGAADFVRGGGYAPSLGTGPAGAGGGGFGSDFGPNLLVSPTVFDHVAWAESGGAVPVAANSPSAPWSELSEADAGNVPGRFQLINIGVANAAGTNYICYVRFKKTGVLGNYPGIDMRWNGAVALKAIIVDTANGTAAPRPGWVPNDYGVEDDGDGWIAWMSEPDGAGVFTTFNIGIEPALSGDGTTISVAATGSTYISNAYFGIGTIP